MKFYACFVYPDFFCSTDDHLDSKHCETLEEVFRRVQFRTIDIEATRLDEEVHLVAVST